MIQPVMRCAEHRYVSVRGLAIADAIFEVVLCAGCVVAWRVDELGLLIVLALSAACSLFLLWRDGSLAWRLRQEVRA